MVGQYVSNCVKFIIGISEVLPMCYPFVIFACIAVKMFNSATLGKPSSTFKFRIGLG